MQDIRTLNSINLKQKKVFLRLDLNVPIKNDHIQDETRITAALPTIRYILENTHKLCICSHLGRPKGQVNPKYSLRLVGSRLAELLNQEVLFVEDYVSEPVEQLLNQLDPNQIILLENLRFYPGEEKNDIDFARKLVKGFEVYVNDAFGAVHRAHASVDAAAECFSPQDRAAGFLIEKELKALSQILFHTEHPFAVVIGGAKVSDKITVILNLMTQCNQVLIGGAMAYSFLKYKGHQVGSSLVEHDQMNLIESIYRNAEARKIKIALPEDHICGTEFVETAKATRIDSIDIPEGMMGLDIGPKTIAKYQNIIKQSKTVFWNGPMGVFEWPPFSKGTMAIAQAMAECQGVTMVGGGDSVAAVNKASVADQMTHISTGGGASLEYLEGKILPGIRVLYK